jgi:hypothetical protein
VESSRQWAPSSRKKNESLGQTLMTGLQVASAGELLSEFSRLGFWA